MMLFITRTTLKRNICSLGDKFFSLELIPNDKGGKKRNGRVASPKVNLLTFMLGRYALINIIYPDQISY